EGLPLGRRNARDRRLRRRRSGGARPLPRRRAFLRTLRRGFRGGQERCVRPGGVSGKRFFRRLAVIARSAATKQSSLSRRAGLLRSARNDGVLREFGVKMTYIVVQVTTHSRLGHGPQANQSET